jgi:hypothetical protein
MRYSPEYINSELMDQPICPEGPAKKLLILSPPRTGSSMLCRMMLHAAIGVPHEYFNELFVRVIGDRFGLPGA